MKLYHGGIPGKAPGDTLVPSPPHEVDGCPICVARAEGRGCTVGAYRLWLRAQGPKAAPILELLADAPAHEILDPPSGREAIYATTDRPYARWYAARSRGDLYEVRLLGEVERSTEDHFPTWHAPEAVVVRVVERRVRLTRKERRALMRRHKKADKRRASLLAVNP